MNKIDSLTSYNSSVYTQFSNRRNDIQHEKRSTIDDWYITVSGGLKQYNNEELAEFVHQADLNLYQAKATGKNKVIS